MRVEYFAYHIIRNRPKFIKRDEWQYTIDNKATYWVHPDKVQFICTAQDLKDNYSSIAGVYEPTELRYQVLSGYKGTEWTTSTRFYRSYERAWKGAMKSKAMFGNACLVTHKKTSYGYELVETRDV